MTDSVLPGTPDLWAAVAGTGHRWATPRNPDGLDPADRPWLEERARAGLEWFAGRGVTECWSGMACGFDLVLAAAALDVGLPLVAHIPYESQPDRWPETERAEWRRLRTAARSEHVYGPNPTARWQAVRLLHARNDGLLKADLIYAAWNGKRSGGTWSAVEKAQKLGRRGVLICPVTRRVRMVNPGEWFESSPAPASRTR